MNSVFTLTPPQANLRKAALHSRASAQGWIYQTSKTSIDYYSDTDVSAPALRLVNRLPASVRP